MKIGFSEVLHQRLIQLSPLLPGLRMLGFMPGTQAEEKRLHKQFAADRDRGEWFRKSAALRRYLESVRLQPFALDSPKQRKAAEPRKAVHMLLEESLLEEIRVYRHKHRLPNRAETIKTLLIQALAADKRGEEGED